MQNIKKSVIVVLTIFMMCVQCFFPLLQSFATEEVNVTITSSPVIDIVLSKAKTTTDVSNFKTDIINSLKNQEIDTSYVNVSAVETVSSEINESDATEVFNTWSSYNVGFTRAALTPSLTSYTSTTASDEWTISGDKIQRNTANSTFSLFMSSDFNDDSDIKYTTRFGLNVANSSIHGEAWYFFKIDESMKNGYGLVWDNHTACGPFSNADYQLYLIKMTNGAVSVLNSTTVAAWAVGLYWDADIEVVNDIATVKITGTNSVTWSNIDVSMSSPSTQAFGTFSFNGSYFSNNTVEREVVKKYTEVLRMPDWRENSIRVLVNISDEISEDLNDESSQAELLTRLLNENINFVAWGNSTNKSQYENLITANNNNGIFINNTSYSNSITSTAKYIKSLLTVEDSSEYVLLNEDVNITVTPESAKSNTQTDEYPYGKWKILHDYEYFENNLGQFANSGKYMPDFTMSFDKTGRYELLYADQNITPKYIYVHRKPVADFSVARNASNVTLTSISYDLDSYSNNNGISEEEWKYKKVGETTWTDGKLTTLGLDEIYVIQLRVKDFQETWSNPITKYITYTTTVTESTPIASFSIKSATITKYENLEVVDSSYDPAGLDITNEVWTVKKDGTVIYTGSTPLTDYNSYGIGTYNMSLVVTNKLGTESEEFSRIFYVVDDTTAPEVVATPVSSDWTNQPVEVKLEFSDKGGSEFKGYKYSITDSQATPTTWSDMILNESDSVTIGVEGEKYLHIIGYDNAGNVSEDRVLGPYKIDLTDPEIDSIVPENKDWTNESISINVEFSDEGGSGFSGYKYAITTSESTPDTWSEIIKEDTAEFSISNEAAYYLHIITYDNAGNESVESVYGPYEVDKTAPEVVATPVSSDWTNQPVEVKLEFSDTGGSEFKGYKYSITDSQATPTTWSDMILNESDSVTIGVEGEKYLHIITYDNAGNVSEDRILGPYKIDLTDPEIDSIVPENKDWTNESISINVSFSDKGGSGFSGYKYAITTSESTPDTWSEIIKEDTAEISISNEAAYYLHIITYDNAGNESVESVYGPYEVDKTSPEVVATPVSSDWTNQPVEVKLEFSDTGGSEFKGYKYSITDSGIMPEKWEYEIEGEPEPITISKEGESYLHIIGYDNAGNDSSDNIFGKYKIDYTLPDLISDNEVNSDTELSSITFSAIDDASGVEKFIVNGTEIDGNQYTATINGEYEFEIWDNAGNVFVKNLTINNIFFECDQELEHPTYSSSYEKCPICELIDGINVTVEEKVYEGEPLGISYDNNKNAEIVEYYNGALDKPTLVGEYNYELKVVYNDAEHNTGINGILTINKKKLDIIGLKLEDKIYDGKLEVNIDKTNAAVEGIVDNDVDYVELEIPNVVSYDSLDRGNKTVALEKDIDYKLKLKDDVDSSYEVLIDCYNLPESIILSGKLIAGQYSITYENVNDADNSENLTSYTIENGKVELKDISRTGYTFTGWYTEKDCINKVTEIDCNDLEDKILYANWIANKYAITYNNCEDVTENQNPTEYTIEDEKIILKPAEKTGYIFKGWYTDETFTNAITEIEPTQLQNMQLYALWEEILYVKSDIYTIQEDESGANIYNVPKHTLVSKFLENIQTNATTVEIYYPHGVRLENDKLIESGLTMIIQAGSQRKEFKIYLKEDSKIENNNSSSIIENKINTTENNFTTSKVIKDKISGILPYAGSENRAVILLAAVIVLVFDIIFKRVLNRKK